jgi:HSP20 family protein
VTVLEKWTPFRDLDLMERRMRSLFPALTVPALPATDIIETATAYVFELEVPGYEEQELDIEVVDHTITISGHRQDEEETTDQSLRLHERLEAEFERSFQLPFAADGDQLTATYRKGLLTLRVPKVAKSKPMKVPIEPM